MNLPSHLDIAGYLGYLILLNQTSTSILILARITSKENCKIIGKGELLMWQYLLTVGLCLFIQKIAYSDLSDNHCFNLDFVIKS
jgi:hypothetical protein